LDLPGHGRHSGETDPARFTLDAVERELLALTDGEPADLVGYSMGGRVALAFTARHPKRVRRLVLESSSPGLATEAERAARRRDDGSLADWIEHTGIKAFVARWEGMPLFESQKALPGPVRDAQRARRWLNHPASLAASLRGMGTGALPSFWGSLPGLRVPVLLMAGVHDPKFVDLARRMAADLPLARLELVAGAGHSVHLERPGAWVDLVADFLTEEREAE
jgi:2-succinyl-6-hydroxy-2,4-cyclohexadiene-1-carboxylate synthase